MATLNLSQYAGGWGIGVNMDALHLSDMFGATIQIASSTHLQLTSLGARPGVFDFYGVGFTYDGADQITGGQLQSLTVYENIPGAPFKFGVTGLSTPIAQFAGWIPTDATQTAFGVMFAGDDTIYGSDGGGGGAPGDLIRSYGGNDSIMAGAGPDTVVGGSGDDSISGSLGDDVILGGNGQKNYLRGDDGDDRITGGSGFDDINGNKGNDTIDGGPGGGDWLVGGQGNDLITAHASQNILYGNLGNDTLNAGSGGDLMRGGQGDDVLVGGSGNDWLSGDRGNDTITGGAGADTFHTFSGAGIDRVLDFHIAEGDKVQVDAGTIYTVIQQGADTVIDMGGGDQMILVGVDKATLTPGWIFTV